MNVSLKHVGAILSTLLITASTVHGYAGDREYHNHSNECCLDYCNNNCSNYRVEGEYLYWQLRQPWSSYSVEKEVSSELTINKDKTFQLGYHSGFRLGFYYDNLFSCLDLGIKWTSYHVDETKKQKFSSNENPSINFDGVVASLRDNLQVDLDYIDIDFSHRFCTASCFSITPHFGLRFMELDVKEKISAKGSSEAEEFYTLNYKRTIRDEDRGIGLEGGLWGEWQLGCGFSLIGHFGGSVLWYKDDYCRKTQAYITDENGALVSTEYKVIDKDYVPSSNQTFDYYLGVQYKTDLCGRDVFFKLGWEHLHSNFEYYEFEGMTTGFAINF